MMKGGLGNLMKQAQKMQENMARAQEELANTELEGQAGNGLVKVVMTGNHKVKRIAISPDLMAEDRDMLEDLVVAAFNDATGKVEAASQAIMGKATAGMPIPPGMKLPF